MTLRLLIIDDDVVDRSVVRRALTLAGLEFELVEAVDATTGEARALDSSCDCILLDYRLPECTGLDVLRRLRVNGFVGPVVMLTGHGDEDLAVELMKAGASDYVSKAGMNASRLAQSVRQAVHVHRVEEERRRAQTIHSTQLQALASAAIALNTVLSVEAVRESVAERARVMMNAAGATMHLLPARRSADEDSAIIAAIKAVPRAVRASGEQLGGASELARLVALGLPAPKHCWIAVPLVDRKGGSIGVLHVVDSAARTFDDNDEVILIQLAHMAAIAFENAALYQTANEAIKARDDMISIVSHDLRNPLSTIVMAVALLESAGLEAKHADFVLRVKRAAERMNGLVDDLLDMSKIEAGTLTIEASPAELPAIIEEALDPLRPAAVEKGVELVSGTATDLPLVFADRHRLLQVLSNLLGNALKFTPAGGSINVVARSVPEGVVVSVADTGVGIAAESLPHVFERYWQAAPTAGLGAGLGLFITKGIVDAHGGKVTVTSTPGRGTTFSFTLPRAAPNGEAT